MTEKKLRIGLLVNAYAGIGGAAGLKGSDGPVIRDSALAYQTELRSPQRLQRFFHALASAADNIQWFTGAAMMGQQYLEQAGIACEVLGDWSQQAVDAPTTALDSRYLAKTVLAEKLDLLLFVGGDGTARDIVDSVATQIPCLGIPAGVKMQSAVFAISPEAAALIVKGLLAGELIPFAEQDVRDIDEPALREGRVRSKYYGSLQVPSEPLLLQQLKQGSGEHQDLLLDDIAASLTEIMHDSGQLILVGPGRTTAHWMASLGLANTLVGFDAVLGGELVQSDLTGQDILALQKRYPDLRLLISPTGNQGMLLGRGNQQLSPEFLRQLGPQQWLIVSTKDKLQGLANRPLLLDSNDLELDKKLCGLYPIIVGFNEQILYAAACNYATDKL